MRRPSRASGSNETHSPSKPTKHLIIPNPPNTEREEAIVSALKPIRFATIVVMKNRAKSLASISVIQASIDTSCISRSLSGGIAKPASRTFSTSPTASPTGIGDSETKTSARERADGQIGKKIGSGSPLRVRTANGLSMENFTATFSSFRSRNHQPPFPALYKMRGTGNTSRAATHHDDVELVVRHGFPFLESWRSSRSWWTVIAVLVNIADME